MKIQDRYREINDRRMELQRKRAEHSLTPDEMRELKDLTERVDSVLVALWPARPSAPGVTQDAIDAVRQRMRHRTDSSQNLKAVKK